MTTIMKTRLKFSTGGRSFQSHMTRCITLGLKKNKHKSFFYPSLIAMLYSYNGGKIMNLSQSRMFELWNINTIRCHTSNTI